MRIHSLRKGDIAYVLSGRQNSFFPVVVLGTDANGIEVLNEAKQERQWFYFDGRADAEDSGDPEGIPRATLVVPEDWRIAALNARKLFKRHQTTVQDAAAMFGRDPSPENAATLKRVTKSWLDFAAFTDPVAIRARSIQEYREMKNS